MVKEPKVAGGFLGRDEPAKGVQSVVRAHHDAAAAVCDMCPIIQVPRPVAGTRDKGAAAKTQESGPASVVGTTQRLRVCA